MNCEVSRTIHISSSINSNTVCDWAHYDVLKELSKHTNLYVLTAGSKKTKTEKHKNYFQYKIISHKKTLWSFLKFNFFVFIYCLKFKPDNIVCQSWAHDALGPLTYKCFFSTRLTLEVNGNEYSKWFKNFVSIQQKIGFRNVQYRFVNKSQEKLLGKYCVLKKTIYPRVRDMNEKKTVHLNNPSRILMVGNLVDAKGYDLLLFNLDEWNARKYTIDIFGVGPMEEKYKRIVKKRNLKVNFCGYLDKRILLSKMQEYDLLLHTSQSETGPRVVLEAVVSGLPIIATNEGIVSQFEPQQEIIKISNCLIDLNKQLKYFYNLKASKKNEMTKHCYQRYINDFDYAKNLKLYNNYILGYE